MSKGKILVVATSFILGIGAVAAFLGIETVNGPEGAVCFKAKAEAPAPAVTE